MHCADLPRLTGREKEILLWAASGKTAFQTADLLCISTDTVNFHMKNCLRKLGVANKTAAAAKAMSLGLLPMVSFAPDSLH
jgi:DNA-binding CsgD family transcriptional regulator